MKYQTIVVALLILGVGQQVHAGDKVEAAVGGATGGAIGAVIGDEIGDRNGAIVGAAAGAAIGTAIATSDDDHGKRKSPVVVVDTGQPEGRFCPPGQAKKGRC